jgi:tetratricopeptide (TPR) repeat protein
MISTLTLQKTRQPIEEQEEDASTESSSSTDNPQATSQSDAAEKQKELVLTLRQQLELKIRENPEDETCYMALAELHIAENRLFDAQRTLTRALNVADDLRIRERLEDVNMLRSKEQVQIAQQRAKEEPSTDALDLVNKLTEEHQLLELSTYRTRCERYPDNKALQFEFGRRLKNIGSLRPALEPLQAGLESEEHRAHASLLIGEILQQYRQFPKALQCYRQSVQLCSNPQDEPVRRNALYRAGTLASAMGLYDSARQYFEELVKTAPDFQDARSRLDKLNEIDEDL